MKTCKICKKLIISTTDNMIVYDTLENKEIEIHKSCFENL